MGSLLAFFAAALVLLLLPGPAVLFVVTRSVQHGRRAGLVSVLGLSCGALVHLGAAVVGVSALIAASVAAFTTIKLLGAGYLLFLGIKTLVGKSSPPTAAEVTAEPTARHFLDAVVVNLFNPKTAIFSLAFLPQFVDPARGPVGRQIAALGFLFLLLALITDGLYALAAASLRDWLAVRPGIWRSQRYVAGTVYLGLGLSAALTGRKPG
ncbi:MAG TPA: LysE family translocator [Thermoanaerobaculia bacterium]|jgi:threonine/homoserine/homoserine lactone efflux protein|nr:LysE family translocator [Thermoanaerobaculia bacterium]